MRRRVGGVQREDESDGGDGVVRGAWAYELSELPEIDELLAAARAL